MVAADAKGIIEPLPFFCGVATAYLNTAKVGTWTPAAFNSADMT